MLIRCDDFSVILFVLYNKVYFYHTLVFSLYRRFAIKTNITDKQVAHRIQMFKHQRNRFLLIA